MVRLTLSTPLDVRVLTKGMSVGEATAAFNAAYPESGGIVSFLGKVRPGNDVRALELTHYEPLTKTGMEDLSRSALERFTLDGILAWHRVGVMVPGESIVLVAAAARHRRDAFEAADFLMDHLKSAAWFWKRERRSDGWHWIQPRSSDHQDRERWK